jgi:hypothetical protein
MFAIVFGLIEGQRYDWGQIEAYPITITEVIVAGVVLMIVFIIWERFQEEPLVPFSLFANRNFAVGNWIGAAISFGMLSTYLPIIIYLQSVRGFSALVAGLTLAPMFLMSMLTAPFVGRAVDRIGGKYIPINAFNSVSSKGFEIGTGETGARLPAGIPAAAAHQISAIAHDVFAAAYIDAMKATYVLPVVFLAFTAVTTLLIKRWRAEGPPELPREQASQFPEKVVTRTPGRR